MPETPETAEEEPKKKRGKLKIIIPVVVLLAGLGGGGFFMTSSKKATATDAAHTSTTLVPGPVIVLEPITTNLADGHILKVGLSLRLSSKPKEEELAAVVKAKSAAGHGAAADGASPMGGTESVALDLAITHLGSKTYTTLSSPEGKAAAKEELTKAIEEAYEHDVTAVYFNNFVMS